MARVQSRIASLSPVWPVFAELSENFKIIFLKEWGIPSRLTEARRPLEAEIFLSKIRTAASEWYEVDFWRLPESEQHVSSLR